MGVFMKYTEINSYEEYVAYTETYKNKYYFRGQANKGWNIVPSLFRNSNDLSKELETIKEEISNSGMDVISTLFKLQHYGTPTRICDLTISPLSALFFSIEDNKQKNEDGVVYVIDKARSVTFHSLEIEVFSEALTTDNLSVPALANDCITANDIKTILEQNYIIQYDYRFSYSNPRAILQGGTALLFGFCFEENQINRVGTCNIDDIIMEKIIVPAHIKNEITEKLEEIGFTKDTLYQTFENSANSSNFSLTQVNIDLHRRAGFNKIVANYQIDKISFNRDELTKRISDIYVNLFSIYGSNARIWLYFYLDENDLVDGNFICRTEWSEDHPYTIKWTKDYYINRMRYINEQISPEEIISSFTSLVGVVSSAYNEIIKIVLQDNYHIDLLFSKIEQYKKSVKKCSCNADDIGKGNVIVEQYSQAAYMFIKDVERLIDDILFYKDKGMNERFLRYWCEALLKDCTKSKDNFEVITTKKISIRIAPTIKVP
jgi:hypothetical protein